MQLEKKSEDRKKKIVKTISKFLKTQHSDKGKLSFVMDHLLFLS